VETVGRESDFFALGGDSIQSLQVVAALRREGYRLTHRQLFETPTLAPLAGALEALDAAEVPLAGAAPWEAIPLTPIQRWFFERVTVARHHWNQAVVLRVERAVTPEVLEEAWTVLVARHEALRQRFEAGAPPRVHVVPPAPVEVERQVLPVDGGEGGEALETIARRVQGSLDLAAGPLLRVVHCQRPAHGTDLVLVVVHHLAVDGVAWRILLEELEFLCERGAAAVDALGPPVPFSAWARCLERWQAEGGPQSQETFWRRQEQARGARLPRDGQGGEATVATGLQLRRTLDRELSGRLLHLHGTHRAAGAGTVAALLTALTRTLSEWAGPGGVRLDMEGHGREPLPGAPDPGRTVGWCTALYPLFLHTDGHGELEAARREVEAQLAAVPQGGLGYGVLRHGGASTGGGGQVGEEGAEVLFNYLGQFAQFGQVDGEGAPDALLVPVELSPGPVRDPRQRRLHPLEVSAWVRGGVMTVSWSFSPTELSPATVEARLERFLGWLQRVAEGPAAAAPVQVFGVEAEALEDVLDQLRLLEEEEIR
jgi:non-ribosomal peptide synthase protein (TIGR01720 family)